MKALVLEKKRVLRLKDKATPIIQQGQVLLDVEVAGIGGSEYLGYNNPGIRPLPHIMGHSISGVTQKGKRYTIYPLQGCEKCTQCKRNLAQLCDNWSLIGVQSDGGFAQKIVVPESSLVELSKEISWEQASFIEPFANSLNAWEMSRADSQNSIAIIGAGSLGLGLVACAKNQGCKVIEISDLSESRLSASIQLGATKIAKLLKGKFDVVFDTVGSIESRTAAIQLTQKGKKCVFLGFASPMHKINFAELIRHQISLIGSFVYSRDQFQEAIQLVRNCNEKWVNNILFSQVEAQLKGYLNNDFSVIKASLRPN